MSRVRNLDRAELPTYVRGNCRWCGGRVTPPRRTFCRDECVEQWKLRSDPGYRRRKVFERDRGRCAACGRDCAELETRLLSMLYANAHDLDAELARLGLTRRSMGPLDQRVPLHARGMMGRPVDDSKPVWDPRRSLWDCDHVLAVVEGGGSCDLSNLQTLCVWCHKAKTAELARRRAAERKNPTPPEDLFELDAGGADPHPRDELPAGLFELD